MRIWHKPWFSHPYILATSSRRTEIFQTVTSYLRSNNLNLKYQRWHRYRNLGLLITLALDRDSWKFSDGLVSWLINNCVKVIRKLIYIQFCIEMVGLNRSFQQIRNQSENKDMPEKPNCNLDFLQFFFS